MPETAALPPLFPGADGSEGSHGSGTGLPVPVTSFLGRAREIDDVIALLDGGDIRLLTLTGPGGVGKTRLAIEVARRLSSSFADGVRFVPLTSVRDADQVIPAVAHGVGARDRNDRTPLELVMSALHRRHLLLVIDNFEHVLSANPGWLGSLLQASTRLTLVITSRTPVNISGEHRYVVPPLTVPDNISELSESTAIQLFTQRARAVRPDFTPNAATIATVGEICRRLDGLPLAIELAAARSQVLTPATILDRLSDRFSLLDHGPRDAPPRMRSMRDAIAWSHELLPEPTRELFLRLSIFSGGFTLNAVEYIASSLDRPAPGVNALDVMSDLINHSLVRPASGAGPDGRFEMLETIREYSLERLASAGIEREARNAHAEFFRALSAAAWQAMKGADQVEWLNRVEDEHANIQSATDWLIAEDRIEDVVEVAMNMSLFRHLRGLSAGAEALYDQVLRHPRVATPTVTRARALFLRGGLAHTMGDRDGSLRMLGEAIGLFRAHGTSEELAAALWVMGNSLRSSDDLVDAESAALECLAIGRELEDTRIIGAALVSLGGITLARGDVDRAVMVLEDAARVARAAGDAWILAFVYPGLGDIALMQGNIGRAEMLLLESRMLATQLGDHLGLLRVQLLLARLATLKADATTAISHLEAALAAARAMADLEYIARIQLEIGHAAQAQHTFRRATAAAGESLTCYLTMGQLSGAARGLDLLAGIAESAGEPERAAQFLGAADRLRDDIGTVGSAGASESEPRRTGEVARSALGDTGFERALRAGRALGRDEITETVSAFQREVLDPPPIGAAIPGNLTPRERELVQHLAGGLSNQELADAMFVSRRTVATHIGHILTKLDLPSRTAIVAWSIRNGIA